MLDMERGLEKEEETHPPLLQENPNTSARKRYSSGVCYQLASREELYSSPSKGNNLRILFQPFLGIIRNSSLFWNFVVTPSRSLAKLSYFWDSPLFLHPSLLRDSKSFKDLASPSHRLDPFPTTHTIKSGI
jgi:hypothetical protein